MKRSWRLQPSEKSLPHFLLSLSITLTLPKSADKNLPEVMWATATLIPRWAMLANSA